MAEQKVRLMETRMLSMLGRNARIPQKALDRFFKHHEISHGVKTRVMTTSVLLQTAKDHEKNGSWLEAAGIYHSLKMPREVEKCGDRAVKSNNPSAHHIFKDYLNRPATAARILESRANALRGTAAAFCYMEAVLIYHSLGMDNDAARCGKRLARIRDAHSFSLTGSALAAYESR